MELSPCFRTTSSQSTIFLIPAELVPFVLLSTPTMAGSDGTTLSLPSDPSQQNSREHLLRGGDRSACQVARLARWSEFYPFSFPFSFVRPQLTSPLFSLLSSSLLLFSALRHLWSLGSTWLSSNHHDLYRWFVLLRSLPLSSSPSHASPFLTRFSSPIYTFRSRSRSRRPLLRSSSASHWSSHHERGSQIDHSSVRTREEEGGWSWHL